MYDDPEFPPADDERSYDELTFDERDQLEEQEQADYRTLRTGLPARPGTRR